MKEPVAFNQTAFEKCQSEWKFLIPKYQQLADELTKLGITPTTELLIDQVNRKGTKIIKAYEAILEKATLEVKVKNIVKEQLKEKNETHSNPNFRATSTKSYYLGR